MKLDFPFLQKRSFVGVAQMPKNLFAPWETIFDETFLCCFSFDPPANRATHQLDAGGEK